MITDNERYHQIFQDFEDENLITGMSHVVKKGKEATVLCCFAHPSSEKDYFAVKIFKDTNFRNFQNDKIYMEGRFYDKKILKAIKQKSSFGKRVKTSCWVSQEAETLNLLAQVGASVPEPFAYNDQAIIMDYFGDDERGAPLLKDVKLSGVEAENCLNLLLYDIELMLSNKIVHGDLSPYNVLYWENKPIIIDFPQSSNPFVNDNCYELLLRDIKNITHYFKQSAIYSDAEQITNKMWKKHVDQIGFSLI